MWHDVETTTDLLNFTLVAETAAQLVRDSAGQPISIGISGDWGSGKSSLVKMIGSSLRSGDKKGEKYLFLEFNAWLYQGYDDARLALLQAVSDTLVEETKKRKSNVDKALDFAKRVNWLRVGKLLAPAVSGALIGGSLGGPVGAVIGAAGGLLKAEGTPSPEDVAKLQQAYDALEPELSGLLKDKEIASLPKEIGELRKTFEELLSDMGITLVILVDDLDRCLPNTAISTLEAMRLLLFLPRTAFIIAADERMIRNAVKAHFGGEDLSDDLITSYFDKLIQVPLRVPRLGVTEVKGYLILLLADLAENRKDINKETRAKAQTSILEAVRQSWAGGLTRRKLDEAFGESAAKLSKEIEMADQLAGLLVSADRIAGNPRLIKRFLNSLLIRDAIAKAQGMAIDFEELIKLMLFERCASPAAFEFLLGKVAESEDGKAGFLHEIEEALAKDETIPQLDKSWEGSFVIEWLKLNPRLGQTDLRPLLYLSRDRSMSFARFDELAPEGRALMEALSATENLMPQLTEQLKTVGEVEGEQILVRMMRRAKSAQWERKTLVQALHIPKAFPNLGVIYVRHLDEMPAAKRSAPLIPLIRNEEWAKEMMKRWEADRDTPEPVKRAISGLGDKA